MATENIAPSTFVVDTDFTVPARTGKVIVLVAELTADIEITLSAASGVGSVLIIKSTSDTFTATITTTLFGTADVALLEAGDNLFISTDGSSFFVANPSTQLE